VTLTRDEVTHASRGPETIAGTTWHGIRRALVVCAVPWAVTRVITLLALAFARYQVKTLRVHDAKAVASAHNGLLGFDAGWYRLIALGGYGVAHQSLRFFPLLPELTRIGHDVTRAPVSAVLVVLANAFSLAATVTVYVLARDELRDEASAVRAVWLLSLAPAAFVFVMGYSESLFILLATLTFLTIRRGYWWCAPAFGLLAALSRPIGVLLVVPVLIEAIRTWKGGSTSDRVARGLSVAAPVAGLVAFLSWVDVEFGGFFTPVRLQRQSVPRSVSNDPLVNLGHDIKGALSGAHLGSGLHLPWILLAVVLCAVAVRTLPASYSAFAIVVVAAGLASTNFESFERYALSGFPLVIGAATLLRSRRVELTVFTLSAVCLFGYALLAFLGAYVP
jgi:hypothetical protein